MKSPHPSPTIPIPEEEKLKPKNPLKQPLCILFIAAFLNLSWGSSQGWAHMLTTENAAEMGITKLSQREKLKEMISRKDVQPQLEQYGLSRDEAMARLNSLTDAEVSQLSANIEQLPEGQGTGGTILIILVLTGVAVLFLWLLDVIKIKKAAIEAPTGDLPM